MTIMRTFAPGIIRPPAAAYSPNGVVFDGTNDYGSLTGAALSGAADSKSFTLVFAFKPSLATTRQRLFNIKLSDGVSNRFFAEFLNDRIRVRGTNSSGTAILDAESSVTLSTGSWYVVAISLDLSDVNKRHMMIDGTDRFPGTPDVYTNDTLEFVPTGANNGFGATHDGNNKFDGELADWWFETGRYVDFSVGANLAKFYDGSNCLVDKGSDGSTPFGAEPTFYLGDDNTEANWFTDNTSNANDFTLNGALGGSSEDPCGA